MGIGMSVLCFVFLVILGLALWANATRVGFLMLALLTAMFGAATNQKSWEGFVPAKARTLAEQLHKKGVVYHFIGSCPPVEVSDDEVILVRRGSRPDFRIIRVKAADVPPRHFTMIGGLPVEVANPPAADEK